MQLEIGKVYVRRDGEITGPLEQNPGSIFCFKDPNSGLTYLPDGRYVIDELPCSAFNLEQELEVNLPVMKTATIPDNRHLTNSIVINLDHERIIHKFVNGGSYIEYCQTVNGKPFGGPTFYTVEHDNKTTPNDVFNHLGLTQFVQKYDY